LFNHLVPDEGPYQYSSIKSSSSPVRYPANSQVKSDFTHFSFLTDFISDIISDIINISKIKDEIIDFSEDAGNIKIYQTDDYLKTFKVDDDIKNFYYNEELELEQLEREKLAKQKQKEKQIAKKKFDDECKVIYDDVSKLYKNQ